MKRDPRLRAAMLTVAEMARADRAAMDLGVSGPALMEAAGEAVADAVRLRAQAKPTLVLCGPGNNGGDGFVAARHLREAGYPVRVALLGRRDRLKGDCAQAARGWTGPIEEATAQSLAAAHLVIDGLFGAGLARPLDGAARAIVEAIDARRIPCVAIDVPSGIDGDSGMVRGAAARAFLTVTFFRRKPAHLLYPGRALCGEVVVADIGIPGAVLDSISPGNFVDEPLLWLERFPSLPVLGHKYDRGHSFILGGPSMTGAARLAAHAALRVGSGLVTIGAPAEAFPVYAADRPGILFLAVPDDAALRDILADRRKNALLLGPGNGRNKWTQANVLTALSTGRPCVLDADALAAFAPDPAALKDALGAQCVLTPHEGELASVWPEYGANAGGGSSRLERARAVARMTGAVVVIKGADTVIAAGDGRAAIACNAPPDLATAGSGDVLAGLIVGLLAQGMPQFEAACAGVWLHGEAACRVGPGMIAGDLADLLGPVLGRLRLGPGDGEHAAGAVPGPSDWT